MLKYVLLASAMTFAVPALAQDKPAETQTAPGRETLPPSTAATPQDAAPVTTDAMPDATMAEQKPVDPAAPATPVDDAMVAQQNTTAPQAADSVPTAQAAATPVNKADEVAQVVNTEFPTYDKDANGDLNAAEFGSWMVALKSASDPATKADSAETKTWISQAFASADKDKSSSVTKAELTGFLTQG